MKRKKILDAIIILGVAVILLFVAFNTHVYNGLNKGICIDINSRCYGVEIVGQPGFFANPSDW
jgi:hypothetical protein